MQGPALDHEVRTLAGATRSLADYRGQVLLIVNTASQCGLTPQYHALEALHQSFKGRGFSVLGFPCNDFGAQEPGSPEEIQQFCSTRFSVNFPLFEKVKAKGDKSPLYRTLTEELPRACAARSSGTSPSSWSARTAACRTGSNRRSSRSRPR
nr:glutathione peroxidase [Nannocystis pusilla]